MIRSFFSFKWLYRLSSPKFFYSISGKAIPWLLLVSVTLLAVGLFWGLLIAPPDARQGDSFRIIYIHVPSSFLALAGYYFMAAAGAVGLVWRTKLSFWFMKSAASIGASMTFLALFTGAIWGRPSWGTYWVWDARVTSMLILLFLYLGVMAMIRAFDNKEYGQKNGAILALVGTVNVPIIYKSVDWWHTLHQPATLKLTSESTIHIDMLQPLLVMILGFYLFYALAICLFLRAEILYHEQATSWVKDLCVRRQEKSG